MTPLEMAAKAAHPYKAPIAGTWQEKWLERYTAIVRAKALEEAANKCEDLFASDGTWCAKAIRELKA